MTFIISATVSVSIVYFFVALVACLHDYLMVCYRRQFTAIVATVEPDPVAIAPELPDSIRGLREFIRANELQAVVKERIGKTVSKCSKDELMAAIA